MSPHLCKMASRNTPAQEEIARGDVSHASTPRRNALPYELSTAAAQAARLDLSLHEGTQKHPILMGERAADLAQLTARGSNDHEKSVEPRCRSLAASPSK